MEAGKEGSKEEEQEQWRNGEGGYCLLSSLHSFQES